MVQHETNISKETFIRSRDVFERINYLYQLSQYWSVTNPNLAAYYAKLVISISKKSVLRLDNSIKRSICKGCHGYFVEGKTTYTIYKKEHRGQLVKTCKRCGISKRYPVTKS
ncbi:hypothetical protein PGB90_005525 [Kerria lacca]